MNTLQSMRWLIWAMMLLPATVLTGVFAWLWQQGGLPTEPLDASLVWFLVGIAAVAAVLSLVLGRLSSTADEPTKAIFVIVSWGLCEACIVIGFVLGFLGGPFSLVALLMFGGWLLFLLQAPFWGAEGPAGEPERGAA